MIFRFLPMRNPKIESAPELHRGCQRASRIQRRVSKAIVSEE